VTVPERFSWVVEGVIAGMERPGQFSSFEDDLEFLRGEGISAIVNLEEKKYAREYEGFIVKHIPVDDFKAPGLEYFREFMDFVSGRLAENRRIAVHCYAGMGRTNLMLACFLMHHMRIDPALPRRQKMKNSFMSSPGAGRGAKGLFLHDK
jgi:atypical dual specificity phosphatase